MKEAGNSDYKPSSLERKDQAVDEMMRICHGKGRGKIRELTRQNLGKRVSNW